MPRSIQALATTKEAEITDPAHLLGLKVGKLAKRVLESEDRPPKAEYNAQLVEEDKLAPTLLDMMEAQLATVQATSLPGMLAQAIQIESVATLTFCGATEAIKKEARIKLRFICYSLVNCLAGC